MRYKVIALSVGGRNNKIFKSGDEVSDMNFEEGRAEELVTQGFLKKLNEEKAPEETKEPAEKTETVKEQEEKAPEETGGKKSGKKK